MKKASKTMAILPKPVVSKKKVPAAGKTVEPVAAPAIAPAASPAAPAPDALAALAVLNDKQARTRRNRAMETHLQMREHLWPGKDQTHLWLRTDKSRKGFATMPRTMPLILNIVNDVTKHVTTGGKAIPAGKSLLVLWCRVFDEGFLKIESEAVAALEAGYAGERNVTTWREHLAALKDLGFIDAKEGPAGPYQYILLYNPYKVVKALRAKGWVQEGAYTALLQRAMDIGATDLTES